MSKLKGVFTLNSDVHIFEGGAIRCDTKLGKYKVFIHPFQGSQYVLAGFTLKGDAITFQGAAFHLGNGRIEHGIVYSVSDAGTYTPYDSIIDSHAILAGNVETKSEAEAHSLVGDSVPGSCCEIS